VLKAAIIATADKPAAANAEAWRRPRARGLGGRPPRWIRAWASRYPQFSAMRNRISNHKSPNVYLFLLSGREPLYPKLEIPQRLRSRVGESNQVSTRSRLNGTL